MKLLWRNIRCFLAHLWPISRRRRIIIAIAVLVGLGHPLLLRALTWPLMTDDSAAECDYYCIHGCEFGADGYEPFETAAQWHREHPGHKFLVLLPHETRVVEIGAVPSFEQTCRHELSKLGIPAADIESIPADAVTLWDEARALSGWTKEHPDASIRLACSALGGGRLRYVLNKVLVPSDAKRVHIATLADPGFSTQSWWRSRTGVKDFMYAWLGLTYAWAYPGTSHPCLGNAAQFQNEMRARIGEAPP